MNLYLFRAESITDGVFGRLTVPGGGILHTLEDDVGGGANGSCFPAGEYALHRTIYHKKGYETFEIADIPGYSRVLFHPGNTEENTLACVLLGMRRGWLKVPDEDDPNHPLVNKHAVVESQRAFGYFMEWMGAYDSAKLTVEWAPGLP